MCRIVDDICNDLTVAVQTGTYKPGMLVALAGEAFPADAVKELEQSMQAHLNVLASGYANGGYYEHSCDIGGAVIEQIHNSMNRAFGVMPRLVAA